MNLRNKIIIFVILLIAVPLVTTVILILNTLSKSLDDAKETAIIQVASLTEEELLSNTTERSGYYNFVFNHISSQVRRLNQETIHTKNINDLLETYFDENSFTVIKYINPSGEVYAFPVSENFGQNESVEMNDFKYSGELPSEGKWFGPYLDSKTKKVVFSFVMPHYENGDFSGFAQADISKDDIVKKIFNLDETSVSYLFIVKDDLIVSSSNNVFIDLKLKTETIPNINSSEVLSQEDILLYFMFLGKSKGVLTLSGQYGNKIVTLSNIPSLKAKLVSLSPQGDFVIASTEIIGKIENTLKQVGVSSLIVVIIISIVSLFVSLYGFQSLVVAPIQKLKKATDKISKKNYNYKIRIKRKDEMGMLANAFNSMCGSIKQRATQLANAKSKDDAILAGIGEGMIVTDKNRNITVVNKVAKKKLCLKEDDLIGKKWPEGVLRVTDEKGNVVRLQQMPICQTIKSGKVIHVAAPEAYYFLCKDKAKFPVVITSSPVILNEKIIGTVTVFRDITEEKHVEKMKSEFVMLASHQLRTPLTSIKWVTEKLLNNCKKQLSKKNQEYLIDLNNSSNRLARLIEDLLTVSKIEEGKVIVSPEEIDMVEIVNDYFAQSIPWADRKGVKLTFEDHPESIEMFTDKFALENILRTLVANAIDYTKKGGSVSVSLEKKDNSFILKVKDTGIGIPADEQNTIFEKFTRGSNAVVTKTEGTGLGLYIIKKTVEFLGGKIWFESVEKKGTTFFVEIPLNKKEIKE